MFGIIHYGSFVVSSLLLNMTPGSDTIYILSRSATGGKKQGIISALGISTGILIHTVLASLGLSAVLATSALAFRIVKYIGAAYLAILGIRTILAKKNPLAVEEGNKPAESGKTFVQGILTNALNPKVALFFLALLPQFVAEGQQSPLPFLLLGLTFFTTSTLWSCLIASAASLLTRLLTANPKASRVSQTVSGIIYILLGLNVLRARMAA